MKHTKSIHKEEVIGAVMKRVGKKAIQSVEERNLWGCRYFIDEPELPKELKAMLYKRK